MKGRTGKRIDPLKAEFRGIYDHEGNHYVFEEVDLQKVLAKARKRKARDG